MCVLFVFGFTAFINEWNNVFVFVCILDNGEQ